MAVKTLITTTVDKAYQAYIPLFVHCIRTAYPTSDYHIKLFLRDPCPYDVDAELVPMFENFPRYKYNTIALRFVVPPENYEGYDYIYVTDIDMLMMWENVPFDLFHEQEMMKTGLCYSNSTRNKQH